MPSDADTFAPDTPEKPQETPLTPRHEAFCQYFVLGGNATYAARAAGYAPKSCNNQGYRLMRRPRIRARVALARKMAVILHRMLSDGTVYRWTPEAA